MSNTKLTAAQLKSLHYVRAAKPSQTCSAVRKQTMDVLVRLGLVEYVKSPVGTYNYHFQPTAAGLALLEERRLAAMEILRQHLASRGTVME